MVLNAVHVPQALYGGHSAPHSLRLVLVVLDTPTRPSEGTTSDIHLPRGSRDSHGAIFRLLVIGIQPQCSRDGTKRPLLVRLGQIEVEKPLEEILPHGDPRRASGHSQPTQTGKRGPRICGIRAFSNIGALQPNNLLLREQGYLVRTVINRRHIPPPFLEKCLGEVTLKPIERLAN